jgi:hypothetical protein
MHSCGHALEAIERVVCEDRSAQQVVDEIVHRIARATDADAFIAGLTDPDTGLYVGAGLSCNIADALSAPIWEHEFLIPDYNKFADLTAADPVGDLRQATGGRLSRSARYRTLNAIADLAVELRAVLYAGTVISATAEGTPGSRSSPRDTTSARPPSASIRSCC